jgi:hypothetical protein
VTNGRTYPAAKNLSGGIGCEVVNVSIYPYSLYMKEDALINVLDKKEKGTK